MVNTKNYFGEWPTFGATLCGLKIEQKKKMWKNSEKSIEKLR